MTNSAATTAAQTAVARTERYYGDVYTWEISVEQVDAKTWKTRITEKCNGGRVARHGDDGSLYASEGLARWNANRSFAFYAALPAGNVLLDSISGRGRNELAFTIAWATADAWAKRNPR